MMLICPRIPIGNMNCVQIKAKPLVTITYLSFFVMMAIQQSCPQLHHSIVPTTNLVIALALVSNVMLVCHECNAVSAKTLTQSNGLIEKCTIQPLVPRWPKILINYANLSKLQNLVHLSCCPLIVPTCHHTATIPLTLTTMLTVVAAP